MQLNKLVALTFTGLISVAGLAHANEDERHDDKDRSMQEERSGTDMNRSGSMGSGTGTTGGGSMGTGAGTTGDDGMGTGSGTGTTGSGGMGTGGSGN